MNVRTPALLLIFLVLTGMTVLALWNWSSTDGVGQRAIEARAHDDDSLAGPSADRPGGAELESIARDAGPDSRPARASAGSSTATEPETVSTPRIADRASDASESPAATPRRIAGKIRGSFVREGGPWTDETLPAENTVILDLSSIEHPTEPAERAVTQRSVDATGSISWTFEFADVLEGEYLLTLSALGAKRWVPTSLRVRAPLDGVAFTLFDKDPAVALAFEVVDAVDGKPLAQFDARHIQVTPSAENGVFLHTGPLDLQALPLDARFQWSLHVEGYAVAFGDETAFQRRGDSRIAVVRLVRGWSTKLFVLTRDPTAVPARGAEVLLDGVRAGFTGSDGMLVVSAASEPREIDVRVPGFLRRDGAASSGAYSARQRGGVTVVMLDRAP